MMVAPLLRVWPVAPLALVASSVCSSGKAVPLAGRLVVKLGEDPFAVGNDAPAPIVAATGTPMVAVPELVEVLELEEPEDVEDVVDPGDVEEDPEDAVVDPDEVVEDPDDGVLVPDEGAEDPDDAVVDPDDVVEDPDDVDEEG